MAIMLEQPDGMTWEEWEVYLLNLGRRRRRRRGVLGSPGGAPSSTYTLTAGAGSFILTGDDMTPLVDYRIPADVGAFTETGQDASLMRGYLVSAAVGAFTLTGQAVTLTGPAAFTVTPSTTGAVSDLTGGTAGVYTKTIDVGTYVVGRMIMIGVMARANAALAPSSVTISGVNATQVTGGHVNNGSASETSVWYVDAGSAGGPVTTSGNATVVVTFGTAPSRCGFSLYSIYGQSASAPAAVTSTGNSPVTENTLAIPTGGTILVFDYATSGYPTTFSATSFTQDVNVNNITTQGFASLHSTPGALSGTPSVTVTGSSATGTNAWVFVSVGP